MELPEELQERVDIIRHKLKFMEQKPAVVCIENIEPLTLAGNTVPAMVNIAGGNPALTTADQPSTLIQWETLLAQDPDIIIIMPKGFVIEQTIKVIDHLLQLPGFAALKAVKNDRFYIADGLRYFKDTELNYVESVEILAEIINPKQFIFGYEGDAWIKFGL